MNFLRTVVFVLLVLPPFVDFAQQTPNVVLILADDLDAVVTPQFFPEVLPVLDSLKQRGIDFSNSFAPLSICCPSRAALLSGKYGHKTEVLRNGNTKGGWKYFKDDEPAALPARLSSAGYRTAMIGKYLNGYKKRKNKQLPLPFGWTDGAVMVSKPLPIYQGYDYDLLVWEKAKRVSDTLWQADKTFLEHHARTASDYSTDVVAQKAVAFIAHAEQNDSQPFFLYLAPTAPHIPLPPAPRHEQRAKERWLNVPVPHTPSYFNDFGKLASEAEKKKPLDQSLWLTRIWNKRMRQQDKGRFWYNLVYPGKLPKELKSFVQATWYYRMASLYALNDLIKNVVDELKARGEWDNTLLIFTSDNGFHQGSKALYHKGTPYEDAIRVPLIIAAGDSISINTSKQIEDWVINLDLMPTLLQVAGIELPEDIDGKSILPVIEKTNPDNYQPRSNFIMEYLSPGGTDFIFGGPTLNIKLMASPLLDRPSYKAIRMMVEREDSGRNTVKTFKYIEWERYYGIARFRNKLEKEEPKLMAKIAAGNKRVLKKKARAEAVEAELYCVTDDPYEMDNLLYYQPNKYAQMVTQLRNEMRRILEEEQN